MRQSNLGPTQHHVERCICGKKKSTKRQAEKEAKFLKYNKKYPGMIPQTYKCKLSGSYHVGNAI